MSRICWSEDEDYPGQFELWQSNCDRSLLGRRGQNALRELEAALLALPDKRLIAGELDNGDDCCAVGALARTKETLIDSDDPEEVGIACGMPRLVAWKTVEVNDIILSTKWEPPSKEFPHGRSVNLTPEERYEKVLKWVQGCLSGKVTL